MPISAPTEYYASTGLSGNFGGASISPAVTIPPGTTIIGLLIFVGGSQTLSSVVDSVGNTWVVDHASSVSTVSWVRCNVTRPITTKDTITFTFSLATNLNRYLWLEGYANVAKNAFDQIADVLVPGPVSGSVTASAPTGILSQADELAIGVLASGNGTVFSTPTPGFSAFSTVNISNDVPTYEIVNSTASATPTVTVNCTGFSYAFSTATYKATSLAPANSVAPTISGLPRIGASVAIADIGTWTNDGAPSIFYAWQRDNVGGGTYSYIQGPDALNAIYRPTVADIGCNLRCVVTQFDSNGLSNATSNSLGIVSASSEVFPYINSKVNALLADDFQNFESFPSLLVPSSTIGTVYPDAATIFSSASFSGSDTAQYVDSNSARSKTTLSGVDTEQATDANSIRSASRVSAVDTAQFVDTGTIRSHATPTGTDTQSDIDTSSIHSVSRLAISDTAQFVDSGTIRSKITPAVADTKQAVDTGAIRSASRVTGLDTAQYVDSGSIRCKSTAGGSEGSGGTESGTVKSTSRISITELIIRGDSATLVSVSRVAGVDVAIFVDAATLRTTARLVIADQRVVLEVGTIRSITAFSGIEFSAPPIPVVDLLAFMYARWMGSIEQRQYEGNFYSRWSGVCKSIRSVLSSISL